MGGKLVVDEEGCLRLQPGDWIPVWPTNLRLETVDETARIKDGERGIVAEVGKKVYMSGRQIGLSEEKASPRTARELRNRCPGDSGDYWMATDVSRTLSGPPR